MVGLGSRNNQFTKKKYGMYRIRGVFRNQIGGTQDIGRGGGNMFVGGYFFALPNIIE